MTMVLGTKKNIVFMILFIVSTSFFLFQHSQNLSWDFSAYSLNAQYLFGEGTYFEPLRPPLMPFSLGILSIFGWKASEYLYIILVSLFFLYSSIKLAESLDFDPLLLYALSLSPYLLLKGMANGTELLSLALLELFIAYVIKDKSVSGVFLGLAAMARYTNLALVLLSIFHLKVKNMMKSALLFLAVLAPWLIFNKILFGNYLTSIADQYANNIFYRHYIDQQVSFGHIMEIASFYWPLILLGLLLVFYKIFRDEIDAKIKNIFPENFNFRINALFFLLFVYSILSYARVPIKDPRNLFLALLSISYYAYIGAMSIIQRLDIRKSILVISLVLVMINLAVAIQIQHENGFVKPDRYESAISELNRNNLSDCAIMSDAFVFLNYLGRVSEPLPSPSLWGDYLEEGKILLVFGGYPESVRANTSPVLQESKEYLILGEFCTPLVQYNKTYAARTREYIYRLHGYHINTNPCFIMFHDSGIMERACNLANFDGFTLDNNRRIE